MTDARTFECPNCGSPLTTTGAEKEVKCPYCGSTAIVPEELRDAPQVQPASWPSISLVTDSTTYQTRSRAADAGASQARSSAGKFALLGAVAVVVIMAIVGLALPALSGTSSGAPSSDQSGNAAAADFATSAPTATSTPAIPTPVPFSNILFQDDFSSSSSGWPRSRNPNYTLEYKDGQYHILINEQGQGQEVTRTGGGDYPDVSVEVDLQQTAGPSDGLMGLTCRNDNNGNFYSFEISQDGTYGIFLYTNDSGNALDEETLDPNTIGRHNANHLEAVCQGDTLTLLLNGQVLTQVEDSQYTSGGVGMLVRTGSSGDAGEDVVFSGLVVKGP